jgi:putative transposase
LENLALRHQLAVYKKTVTRPKMRRSDRLFWVALSRVWAGWRQALVIVSPNTVLRWQRRRSCEHWTKLSARPIAGRPPLTAEIRALVTTVTLQRRRAGMQSPTLNQSEIFGLSAN